MTSKFELLFFASITLSVGVWFISTTTIMFLFMILQLIKAFDLFWSLSL